MTEADKVSELHQEVKNSLLNEDLEKVKNWQKEAYHKQIMGGFKETKEAEDGFRKAQKPWAKKMKEVPAGRAAATEGARSGGRAQWGRLSHERASTDAVRCPLGLCPQGAALPARRKHPQMEPALQGLMGGCPWGLAVQGHMSRWVGTAPECLEPGPAPLLPFESVCSQLPAEQTGGMAGQ